MSEKILMTKESLEALKLELEKLKTEIMPVIVKRIEEAIKLGDLSENGEYHAAKDDQGWTASRIRELEDKIFRAQVIEKTSGTTIDIGSKIVIADMDGKERSMEIVDQTQADPVSGKISNLSPLGAEFIGKKKGDTVEVTLPSGLKKYTIISVE